MLGISTKLPTKLPTKFIRDVSSSISHASFLRGISEPAAQLMVRVSLLIDDLPSNGDVPNHLNVACAGRSGGARNSPASRRRSTARGGSGFLFLRARRGVGFASESGGSGTAFRIFSHQLHGGHLDRGGGLDPLCPDRDAAHEGTPRRFAEFLGVDGGESA